MSGESTFGYSKQNRILKTYIGGAKGRAFTIDYLELGLFGYFTWIYWIEVEMCGRAHILQLAMCTGNVDALEFEGIR